MMVFPGGPIPENPSFPSGGLGLIPGQGTRFHIPQLRAHMLQLPVTTQTEDPACPN